MNVLFSKDAKNDLIRLNDFILSKNPIAANRIISELIDGMNNITDFPDIGTKVKDFPNSDTVRDIYILDYHVRYLKLKKAIYIIRIWHQKEDR